MSAEVIAWRTPRPAIVRELEPGRAPEQPQKPWLHPEQMVLAQKVLENETRRRCGNVLDLTGEQFGRLRVLKRAGRHYKPSKPAGVQAWLCRCSCGNLAVVSGESLRAGTTQSCGCFARERARLQARLNVGRRKAKV